MNNEEKNRMNNEEKKLMIIKVILSTIKDRESLEKILEFHLGRLEEYALNPEMDYEFYRVSNRYVLVRHRIMELGEDIAKIARYDKCFRNLVTLKNLNRWIQN